MNFYVLNERFVNDVNNKSNTNFIIYNKLFFIIGLSLIQSFLCFIIYYLFQKKTKNVDEWVIELLMWYTELFGMEVWGVFPMLV